MTEWHTLSTDRVLRAEGVDPRDGLSSAEVTERAERFGPNTFTTGKTEPRWRAFLRQYADPMQVVLVVAGIASVYPLKQPGTGLLLFFLTLFNAVLGLRQEGKAAAAVAALQKMMIVEATVRRDGRITKGPADGRLLRAATLEVAESALTGESLPVTKGTGAVEVADTPLGGRTGMV